MKRRAPRRFDLHRETLISLTADDLAAPNAGIWPVQPIPPTRVDPICAGPSFRVPCV